MANDYVPTPAERAKLRRVYDEQKKDQQEKSGAEKAEKGETGTRGGMKSIFKGGGYVRAADGVAQRGKTKGKMV